MSVEFPPPSQPASVLMFKEWCVSVPGGRFTVPRPQALEVLADEPEVIAYFAKKYWEAEMEWDDHKAASMRAREDYKIAGYIIGNLYRPASIAARALLLSHNGFVPEDIQGIDDRGVTETYFRLMPYALKQYSPEKVVDCFKRKRLGLKDKSWIELLREREIARVYAYAKATEIL